MKMSLLIYYAVFISGSVLLIAMAVLVYFNWSEKVQAPLITVVIAGALTVITTIISQLKETKLNASFPTYLIVNSKTFQPTFLSQLGKYNDRMSNLIEYSKNYLFDTDHKSIKVLYNLPQNREEWIQFNKEALIYDIYSTIRLHSNGDVINLGSSPDTVNRIKVENFIVPNNAARIDVADTNIKFKYLKYYHIDEQRKFLPLFMPKGTIISMYNLGNPLNVNQSVSCLTLHKPNFYTINFTVEHITLPSDNQNHTLPVNLKLPPKEKSNLSSYTLMVVINAKFEKLTAANSNTVNYIDWCNQIISLVKKTYDDSND